MKVGRGHKQSQPTCHCIRRPCCSEICVGDLAQKDPNDIISSNCFLNVNFWNLCSFNKSFLMELEYSHSGFLELNTHLGDTHIGEVLEIGLDDY